MESRHPKKWSRSLMRGGRTIESSTALITELEKKQPVSLAMTKDIFIQGRISIK